MFMLAMVDNDLSYVIMNTDENNSYNGLIMNIDNNNNDGC